MRIVLATQHANRVFIPLALMYLKASLVGRRVCAPDEIAIVEFDADAPPETIAHALIAARPDVVGLSCYVWNITKTLAAGRLVKAQLPEVRIVLGRPEVGPVAADVLERHPFVAAIFHSDAEVPLPALPHPCPAAQH